MSGDIEKACREWLEESHDAPGYVLRAPDFMVQSLTALVRDLVPEAHRISELDDECERLSDRLNAYEARIAALEAQQESDHAWIDADAKTKEAQQNEIAELEAALEKADALLERSKTFIAGSVSGTHHPSHNPLWSDIREHFRAKTRKP